jgi:hypothetical protein
LGKLRSLVVLVAALAGGVTASQFPEFAQQYRQRLGGALDELQRIVSDFDTDASRNELTRQQALATYGKSAEPFLHDQGVSMTALIDRYDQLREQRARLDSAPPLLRPLVIMSEPDGTVIQGAWADFEPAVPVTSAGAVWSGIGLVAAGALASFLARVVRPFRRRRSSTGSA